MTERNGKTFLDILTLNPLELNYLSVMKNIYKVAYNEVDTEYNQKNNETNHKFFTSQDKAIKAIKSSVKNPESVEFKENIQRQGKYITFPNKVYFHKRGSDEILYELISIEKIHVNYNYLL